MTDKTEDYKPCFVEAEAGREHLAVEDATFVGDNESRHPIGEGVDAIMASMPGSIRPHRVAVAFDSSKFSSEEAMDWLLASHIHVVRFIKAS